MIPICSIDQLPLSQILRREAAEGPDVGAAVSAILRAVRQEGDAALRRYAREFDQAELTDLEVPASRLQAVAADLPADLRAILEEAADRVRDFHRRQVREGFTVAERPGVILGQKVTPLDRVGLYIPGGTAAYPSSVLMNAIPAKLAGVKELCMVTPPGKDGKIPPAILAAARVCGVDRVFRIGGAQAVAALAYGTESVPRVDKIVGPGNRFVAEAKRQVFGIVGIDMVAGPSEILVLADSSANPQTVAADLLSQAEHDRAAAAVLVTDSEALANAVQAALEEQLPKLKREEIARASIDGNGKIILTQTMEQAVDIANEIAPEHLELCVAEPFRWLNAIQNAGSIFLGHHCPEALGDYFAGPNHTLPTGGTARFSSPLSVDDFVKKSQYIYYTPEALSVARETVSNFAKQEGLTGHARSVDIRFDPQVVGKP